jgi:hypothetical protein
MRGEDRARLWVKIHAGDVAAVAFGSVNSRSLILLWNKAVAPELLLKGEVGTGV